MPTRLGASPRPCGHATFTVVRSSTKKRIGQLWGYLILGVVAYGWLGTSMEPGVIAILSGVVALYALFQAPMWCCATIRNGEPCRNNAYGILLGCHIRQHKWQKVKMVVSVSKWGELAKRVVSSFGGIAALVGATAAVTSAVAAVIPLFTKSPG
jgi:hypothetical protein